MSFQVNLSGETALVTGGTRNIGLAIAQALRSAGARVCVVGLSDRDALAAALRSLATGEGRGEGDVTGELLDVAEEAAVVELFDRVQKPLGPVSILVNGAASRPHEPFTELSRESWTRTLDVILTGAFLTSRELFRRLPPERRGAIVNIGGLSSFRPLKDRVHVIAAKSGLIGLTRALAEEGLGRIRANAVVPGLIATERRPGQSNPHLQERDETRPRGSARDVARLALALSDPTDVYVTGQTVHVDGGRYMP